MKRFDQLYRILRRNPHLGCQFYLRLWLYYFLTYLPLIVLLDLVFPECDFSGRHHLMYIADYIYNFIPNMDHPFIYVISFIRSYPPKSYHIFYI